MTLFQGALSVSMNITKFDKYIIAGGGGTLPIYKKD